MAEHTCPETGAPMKRDVRPLTLTYKGESVTIDMPGWYCDSSGESLHSGKDMKVSDQALNRLKAAAEGLLSPEEIYRIRKKLRLSQTAAGVTIGGGPRAFQKYEKGVLLPSRAISSALMLLDHDPKGLKEERLDTRERSKENHKDWLGELLDRSKKLRSKLGPKKKKIEVFCRKTDELVEEIVFGEDLMRLCYGTKLGVRLTSKFFTKRWLSRAYGVYNDTRISKRKINDFVTKLGIDLEECEKPVKEYRTFNDFFARRLKADTRPIPDDPRKLLSSGDGRLLVFPSIDENSLSNVKWAPVYLMDLFNRDSALVERYRGGSCAILRLCPADYHRFHFPLSGTAGATKAVPGLLHSVSPYALEQKISVYALNKRTICPLETEEFGTVLLMEIGALGVGSIVQTYKSETQVARGDEKGYFKFGGSTTICFVERGKMTFDEDLIRNSAAGIETVVQMGESIGSLCP